GVGVMIFMAAVPGAVALLVGPVGDEPEALGLVARVEDFHAQEPGSAVHEMRAVPERVAHLAAHPVCDHELADDHHHRNAHRVAEIRMTKPETRITASRKSE